MKQKMREECYRLSLNGYTYTEIAEKKKVSRPSVARAISSITKSHDYQLGATTMAQFLEKYSRASDYFEMKKRELNVLLDGATTDQKIRIIIAQADMEARALSLAKQGQLVQALKAVKDGRMRIGTEAEANA